MRRSVFALAAGLAITAAAPAAQAQTMVAPIDQSVTLNFPAAARDIVIGNPLVVDVNLISSRSAVLIGKAYGVTSVHVFDNDGRSIFARQVVVSSSNDSRVSYFRGAAETSFACATRCERTLTPGATGAAPTPSPTGTP